MTEPPLPPYPPKVPPPPKHRPVYLRVAAALVVIAAAVGTGVLIGSDNDSPAPKAAQRSSTPDDKPTIDDDILTEDEPTVEYEEYGATDFLIELKTTSKDCFGSAGCIVTVEPELTFMWETEDIDPDATYSITYEITGDEDGPVIDTLTLTNQSDISYNKKNLSTSSSSTELDVEITDVSVY